MTFEKVKEIIVDTFNCDEELVTMEASLSEDLGADSLAAVELVMAMEEEFDIEVSDEDAATLKTVKDIVDYVDSHK